MMVRFATTCDRCSKRSEEYSSHPTCRDCGEHICEECAAGGTLDEADLDHPATVLCMHCYCVREGRD